MAAETSALALEYPTVVGRFIGQECLMPSQIALQDVDPRWAWAPYEPSAASPWNRSRVSHLLRRVGFSGTWSELQQALADGPTKTVERLLTGQSNHLAPRDELLSRSERATLTGGTADQKKQDTFYREAASTADSLSSSVENLPGWWLYVMLHTPHPVLEKIALFWHGHFATSAAKVDKAELMLAQNQMLREHALRPFGPLVGGIAKDPAMLLWLDSATNKKFKPNENFAREVMELFCLGLGNYTERDIKQAARAFTGWEVRHGKFFFNANQHDEGAKTVLGKTDNFSGEDVLKILLEQPAAGRFLAGKMYRYLMSETAAPPPRLLDPLAAGYREHNYDTAWLVRTIVSSNLFYSPHAMQQRVKAPVEMAIGLVRSLEGTANTQALADDLRKLGQGLFYPPNVKGWDGGTEWINSATLLSRVNLVWALVSGRSGQYKKKIDLEQLTEKHAVKPPGRVRWLADLSLGVELPKEVYNQLASVYAAEKGSDEHLRLARVMQAIAALPEFHVA
jgi:uncharacterized protein (DUF1800 family)